MTLFYPIFIKKILTLSGNQAMQNGEDWLTDGEFRGEGFKNIPYII